MRFADVVSQKSSSLVIQIDPPKGTDLTPTINSSLAIRGRVDALYFPDNPMAIMRMNPLAPCHLLQQKKMETILNINARDRNRLSFQSDLLAAWALGVQSIVLNEGEDPAYGDHPVANPCQDLTMEGMLDAVSSFKEGKDLAGQPIEAPPSFHVGISIKITDDIELNRRKAEELSKWAALGVHFVFLGSTYEVETIKLFSSAAAGAGIKLFPSVLLLKSVGMAKYLNTIAGTPNIPDEIIRKIMKAPIKQKAGIEIAAEFMGEIDDLCAGTVIVPLGWEAKVPELLDLLQR